MSTRTELICQKAWDALGSELRISRERFLEACRQPAQVCAHALPPPVHVTQPTSAVIPILSPRESQFQPIQFEPDTTQCVAWMAGVGRWTTAELNEPNRRPLSEQIDGPFASRPYKLLWALSRTPIKSRAIAETCSTIAHTVHASKRFCGDLLNIERVCKAVAYLTCEAPADSSEREAIATYAHIEQCLLDNDNYLHQATSQIYFFAPLSYWNCSSTGRTASSGAAAKIGRQKNPAGDHETETTPHSPLMVLGGVRMLGAELGESLSANLLPQIHKGRVSLFGLLGVEVAHVELTTPHFSGPHHWELGLNGGAALGFSAWQSMRVLVDLHVFAGAGYESEFEFSTVHLAIKGGLGLVFPKYFDVIRPVATIRYGADLFLGSQSVGDAVHIDNSRGLSLGLGALF